MDRDHFSLQLRGKKALNARQLLEQNLNKVRELGLAAFANEICRQMFGHSLPESLSGDEAVRYVETIHPMIFAAVLQRRKRQ